MKTRTTLATRWKTAAPLLKRALSASWDYLRELTGETAYERYLQNRTDGHERRLTCAEFYLQRWEEKYSRPSRCC